MGENGGRGRHKKISRGHLDRKCEEAQLLFQLWWKTFFCVFDVGQQKNFDPRTKKKLFGPAHDSSSSNEHLLAPKRKFHICLILGKKIQEWRQFFVQDFANLNFASTKFFLIPKHCTYICVCLTDGTAWIFSYHFMPWPGFEIWFLALTGSAGLCTFEIAYCFGGQIW